MKPISIAEHTQFANPCTRVAIEHESKYLMVQEGKEHVYGLWAFPGGKVDVNELLTVSAIREVKEETGIDIELTGFLGLYHTLWDDRPGYSTEFEFLAKATFIPEVLPISPEIVAIEWKTVEEIQQLVDEKKMRNYSQEGILQMLQTGIYLPISSVVELKSAPKPPEARA